jgi:hypothetical protein
MPMLIQELAMHAQAILATAPMKEPLLVQSWNFVLASSFTDTWFLRVTMLKLQPPVGLKGQDCSSFNPVCLNLKMKLIQATILNIIVVPWFCIVKSLPPTSP